MTTLTGRQYVPEQLGAPCLLYRHTSSTWNIIPRPWGLDDRYVPRYLHQTEQSRRRVSARWFHAVDHPFRRQGPLRKRKRLRKRRTKRDNHSMGETHDEKDRQELNEESAPDRNDPSRQKQSSRRSHVKYEEFSDEAPVGDKDEDKGCSSTGDEGEDRDGLPDEVSDECRVPNRLDDPLLNPHFLSTRTLQVVDDTRQHLLGPDSYVIQRSYQQYDHAYVTGQYRTTQKHGLRLTLPCHHRRLTRSMAIDRLNNADTAYLAPVDYSSLHYCLNEDDVVTKEEKKLFKSNRRRVTYPIDANTTDSPVNYGNCLVCVPCPCDICKSDGKYVQSSNDAGPRRHGWCLIHPTGEMLSRVCISSLLLPYGARNSAPTMRDSRHKPKKHELEVGDTILQISSCGNGDIGNAQSNRTQGLFIVRSENYCTVIRITAEIEKKTAPLRQTDDESEAPRVCPGMYCIHEVARIDLRSLCRSLFRSFKPKDVATHPHYGNLFSNPKFAILSHSSNMERNTIHHVILWDTPLIDEHNIPCLKAISHIEFTRAHPMTLWAAAESYVRPKLVTDLYSTKPLIDHGHSLYTIDLRNNEAVFQWSPSAEEMLVEGIHSINALMTDWQKEHSVWVSSSSAGKTWEIDVRMPCRAVNSFSLAAVYDDDRSLLSAMGLHGGGSILTQPVVSCYDKRTEFSSPVLSVDKSPGAAGMHIFQRPEFRPRFQTNCLECVACPGLSSHDNEPEKMSVATTSNFALPEVSEDVFICGLASFRTLASEFLAPGAVESLGYHGDTESVMCAVTMTNKGDIYSHAFLECPNHEENRSKAFPGLRLGTTALGIPTAGSASKEGGENFSNAPRPQAKAHGGWNLSVSLTNEYPITSTELAPMSVMTRNECRSFTTVKLERIPTFLASRSAEAKAELPVEDAAAAYRDSGSLQDCFLFDRKSVVECDVANDDTEFRSDMTAEVLQAASRVWKEEEDFASHIAHVKEEPEDSFEQETSI